MEQCNSEKQRGTVWQDSYEEQGVGRFNPHLCDLLSQALSCICILLVSTFRCIIEFAVFVFLKIVAHANSTFVLCEGGDLP